MSHFSDVNDFHTRFRLEVGTYPHLLNDEELNLRVEMFHEEIIEFTRAHRKGDLVAAFDALLDLAYFVIGTAVKMCLPWNRGWMAVHFANMRKARVPSGETSATLKTRKATRSVQPQGRLRRSCRQTANAARQSTAATSNPIRNPSNTCIRR